MHHVLTQLYLAEIAQRIPVVYWGKNCMYGIDENSDAFQQFFRPISKYGIQDLIKEDFSYFPEEWNRDNLLEEHLYSHMDISLDDIIHSEADVVVQNSFIEVEDMMYWIEKHPLYGYISRYLYSSMLKKYIRLQPLVEDEISEFFDRNMINNTIIAVHIRGSDKIVEIDHLFELNKRYPAEIDKVLKVWPEAKIFLMTDCRDILEQYSHMYPNKIMSTECNRVLQNGPGSHFQEYEDKARKGLEIIKDTWLAARCDYFIGNGYSNVSLAISELKDWDRSAIKLLY
jgi:hypothetical protein